MNPVYRIVRKNGPVGILGADTRASDDFLDTQERPAMGLAELLINLLYLYSMILVVRALMSWIDPGFRSAIGKVIFQITEPVVEPIRRVMPPMGGLDFSIMVAVFLCIILQRLVASAL